jgi:hypothetical protein
MFTNGNGYFYEGDCVPGDRDATEEEVTELLKNKEWNSYQLKIKELLAESDLVVLRCYEKGISVNILWQTYRSGLRSILSSSYGDPTQPFPEKPDYPEGT